MLSLKFIRENIELVKTSLNNKNSSVSVHEIINLDIKRREIIQEVENLKFERNKASKSIAEKKKNCEDANDIITQMRAVSEKIKELDESLKNIDNSINEKLLYFPNLHHSSVPVGKEETENIFIRSFGEKPIFDFDIKDHITLCEQLELVDFKRAIKMSGSGFPLYTKMGAKLERALINFMLDYHVDKHGYSELFPPFLTTSDATRTTGQLPKFEEDMYKIPVDDLYCISTAEVPVTNIHREEVISESELPKCYTAYSACFRREAGSYGKDTRGLLRVHQFNKVEMVKFVKPEDSYNELEKLVVDAEDILQALGLHYKIIELCTGDLSFSAAKCYDIEVWSPGENKYLEVSSCSNFEDFQARRGDIRYRKDFDQKVEFVHTLNGSGVATPRLVVALLETYQQEDGSVSIPEVLQSYMKTAKIQ